MDSLAPIGAQTKLEDLTRKEQHDTINPRLNIIFQSESTERLGKEVELELSGTRDTGDVGSTEDLHDLVILSHKTSARERESDHHGVKAPFPPSRMPASIDLSIKLVVCLREALAADRVGRVDGAGGRRARAARLEAELSRTGRPGTGRLGAEQDGAGRGVLNSKNFYRIRGLLFYLRFSIFHQCNLISNFEALVLTRWGDI